MAYIVTGSREGERFTSSRHEIASAVYLARRLREEGTTTWRSPKMAVLS